MQPDDTKARLEIEGRDALQCQFNPAEISISKQTSWEASDSTGVNAPKLEFKTGRSGTLKTTLTFDTTAEGESVTASTDALLAAMQIDKQLSDSDSKRNKGRPPWVQLRWGQLKSFKAVLESVSVKFTYFAQDGTPLRAKCDVTLKQLDDEDEAALPLQNPTSHTPYPHTVHRVQPGETLDRIAARHYGDATRWRLIARANDVLDPLLVEPGTPLTIGWIGDHQHSTGADFGPH